MHLQICILQEDVLVYLCCILLCMPVGVDRFYDNIEQMLGFRINIWLKICWKYITPFLTAVRRFSLQHQQILIFNFISHMFRLRYQTVIVLLHLSCIMHFVYFVWAASMVFLYHRVMLLTRGQRWGDKVTCKAIVLEMMPCTGTFNNLPTSFMQLDYLTPPCTICTRHLATSQSWHTFPINMVRGWIGQSIVSASLFVSASTICPRPLCTSRGRWEAHPTFLSTVQVTSPYCNINMIICQFTY
jgi:hypothetical protein